MRSLREEVVDGELVDVQRLIDEGADVNERGRYGMTPLNCALYGSWLARNNPKYFADSMRIIQLLLDNEADVTLKDDNERDTLQWALKAENQEAARLIEKRLGLRRLS